MCPVLILSIEFYYLYQHFFFLDIVHNAFIKGVYIFLQGSWL